MSRWDDSWPEARLEQHYGDRVMRCFVERPRSLFQMLSEAASQYPDNVALVDGAAGTDGRLTYGDLLERSGRLAGAMAARGVVRGDRVALMLGNGVEFVLGLFAIARLGAVSVPISVREQTAGLAYMLGHSAAVLLIHQADLADRLPADAEVPALRHRVGVGGPAAVSQTWDDWLSGHDASAPLLQPAEVDEEDTAAVLYTSGTTGKPKGAMLSNLGIVHSSMHYGIAMGLGPRDSTLAAVPLSHVTGLVALVTTFVRCAGKLVIMREFKAAECLRLLAAERITHTLMVPAMYNLCLLNPEFGRHDLTAWRVGAYGGAPMPLATIKTLADAVPSLTLMNVYGSTETTSPVTTMPQGETAAHNDTVGVPLHCADICVMSIGPQGEGREAPAGELGEIWVKGPMVVKGYWNDPAATTANFTAGYWRSGDIGSLDAGGYLRVVDRMKDMINRGGYKIYTIEVENALHEHPAVQECAVVAKPCPVLGERVHAYVSLRAPGADLAELKAHCASRLSDYKVPETMTLSTTPLPRNANGKLLKRALRDEVAAQAALEPGRHR